MALPMLARSFQFENAISMNIPSNTTGRTALPAAMGPIQNIDSRRGSKVGISDYGDYYWGRGPVGKTIPSSEINGWWYIQGTSALEIIP